jgi:uncharacterized protein (DUF302 family)
MKSKSTIKKASFKKANAVLQENVAKYGWDIVHTINVDKTAKIKTPYKTHLLCKAKHLKEGVKVYKNIGLLIPCKITIRPDGAKIKVMVEDVVQLADAYNIKDKKIIGFLKQVQLELISILENTKHQLEPRGFLPQY